MKLPKLFIPEKNLENSVERFLKVPVKFQREYDNLEIIRADTYAKGIEELGEQGHEPFTFLENVEASIAYYEAKHDNVELFGTWLDSVTGVAYKAHSTKFKLILRSDKLENIPQDFKQSFISIDYDAEQDIELDSTKDKYCQPLTREEAKNHEFWITVMNSDKEKLAKYVNMWFDKTGKNKGMGVYLRNDTDKDELRALTLNGFYSSIAIGDDDLGCTARFLSGAQQK